MFSRLIPVAGLLAGLSCFARTFDASACGMFVPQRLEDPVPAIAQEQVVMIFDRDRELQHFVREVHFDAGDSTFGFVVPTPTKPTVAGAKSPFPSLAKDYPFQPPRDFSKGGSRGIGEGAPGGGAPAVSVLSVQRVGKFTAFVLAATESKALSKWLADNKFQVPAESQAWLDHYVQLGFFYVAFRYDPPKKKDAAAPRDLASETVRISFSTPHPYYPYLEPTGSRTMPRRLLQVWLVTDEPMRPIAARELEGRLSHTQPWRAGLAHPTKKKDLARSLGALGKLLPKDDDQLWVQTFRDTRTTRRGFGDVLLVPTRPVDLSADELQKRAHLLPVLDPALAPPAADQGGAP